MAAVSISLMPGSFFVDVLPIRMSFSQSASPQPSYDIHFDSQIRPGMVPRSWFQEAREESKEESW